MNGVVSSETDGSEVGIALQPQAARQTVAHGVDLVPHAVDVREDLVGPYEHLALGREPLEALPPLHQ